MKLNLPLFRASGAMTGAAGGRSQPAIHRYLTNFTTILSLRYVGIIHFLTIASLLVPTLKNAYVTKSGGQNVP